MTKARQASPGTQSKEVAQARILSAINAQLLEWKTPYKVYYLGSNENGEDEIVGLDDQRLASNHFHVIRFIIRQANGTVLPQTVLINTRSVPQKVVHPNGEVREGHIAGIVSVVTVNHTHMVLTQSTRVPMQAWGSRLLTVPRGYAHDMGLPVHGALPIGSLKPTPLLYATDEARRLPLGAVGLKLKDLIDNKHVHIDQTWLLGTRAENPGNSSNVNIYCWVNLTATDLDAVRKVRGDKGCRLHYLPIEEALSMEHFEPRTNFCDSALRLFEGKVLRQPERWMPRGWSRYLTPT